MDENLTEEFNKSATMCISSVSMDSIYQKFGFFTFSLLENVTLLLALLMDKNRLKRQNCIYLCGISSIAMNVVLALTPFLNNIMDATYPKEAEFTTGQLTIYKIADVTLKVIAATLMFAACGNVLANIFVLLDGGFFLRQTFTGQDNKKKENWYRKTKRRVAIGLVTYAWLFPLLMILVGILFMNCSKEFCCEMNKVEGTPCPIFPQCSTTFSLLKIKFTFMNACIWMFQILIMICFLIYAVTQFRRAPEFICSDISSTIIPSPNDTMDNKPSISGTLCLRGERDVVFKTPSNTIRECNSVVSSTTSEVRKKRRRKFTKRFHFAFIMIALYILCSLPVVSIIIVEAFYKPRTKKVLNILAGTGTFIYSIVSPILMLIYMPCMAAAVRSLFQRIKRTLCCS